MVKPSQKVRLEMLPLWNTTTTDKHIQMDILAQGVASYRFFISVYKMVCQVRLKYPCIALHSVEPKDAHKKKKKKKETCQTTKGFLKTNQSTSWSDNSTISSFWKYLIDGFNPLWDSIRNVILDIGW